MDTELESQDVEVILLLTVEQAMRALNISRPTFYELINSKQVRTIKIGKARRVPLKSLQDFINEKLEEW